MEARVSVAAAVWRRLGLCGSLMAAGCRGVAMVNNWYLNGKKLRERERFTRQDDSAAQICFSSSSLPPTPVLHHHLYFHEPSLLSVRLQLFSLRSVSCRIETRSFPVDQLLVDFEMKYEVKNNTNKIERNVGWRREEDLQILTIIILMWEQTFRFSPSALCHRSNLRPPSLQEERRALKQFP